MSCLVYPEHTEDIPEKKLHLTTNYNNILNTLILYIKDVDTFHPQFDVFFITIHLPYNNTDSNTIIFKHGQIVITLVALVQD